MTTSTSPVLFSLLDLSPILPGSTASASYAHSVELARTAEAAGYHRYWLAEHHNISGIASAATAVLIGHVAGATRSMRIGAGGIMLPNHAPLVIAEQFGTLESLYPGRIDLGLGRAPGGDQLTALALRRGTGSDGSRFPEDLAELQAYFQPGDEPRKVHAIPGEGLSVPIYLLGSSDFSARLAAAKGLPFAFASHFAPDYLEAALALYRDYFRPSAVRARPHAIVGVNAFVAPTDEEARKLFTSLQQTFVGMLRGARKGLQPPVESMDDLWTPAEAAYIGGMTRISVVGSPKTARTKFAELIEATQADELMLTAHIFDPNARKRSVQMAADVLKSLT